MNRQMDGCTHRFPQYSTSYHIPRGRCANRESMSWNPWRFQIFSVELVYRFPSFSLVTWLWQGMVVCFILTSSWLLSSSKRLRATLNTLDSHNDVFSSSMRQWKKPILSVALQKLWLSNLRNGFDHVQAHFHTAVSVIWPRLRQSRDAIVTIAQ